MEAAFQAGFNANSNQCLCIVSPKSNLESSRALYLETVSNSKCDRHCDNILGDSKVKHNFQCGSLSDQRIWAIYDLNYACPIDFVYVEEFQKCVFAEKGYRSTCSSPSITYVYDGNVTWNVLLRIIEKLHLTKSRISINFDNNVTIDPSWKCSNTENVNVPSTTSIDKNLNTNYVLERGCLLVVSGFSYLYRLSNKLCVEDPLNKDSISKNPTPGVFYRLTMNLMNSCPTDWFDLNGNCYRMSTEPKTIQEASVSCINKPIVETKDNDENIIFNDDDDDDDDVRSETNDENKNYTANIQNGEIVQYTSEWQAHLGYYLLDTNISSIQETPQPLRSFDREMPTLVFNINISRSSINEFQMINLNENKNSTVKGDSCILSTRSVIDEKESSVISNAQMNNCSKPRHVLCKTRSPYFRAHEHCLSKPLTLGLPTLISNYLSHELCITMCMDLKTNSVVLNKNKCYCLNADYSKMANNKLFYEQYRTKDCGNFCPGNQHQYCGNENVIITFYIFASSLPPIFDNNEKMPRLKSDFVYESCIHLNIVDQSTMYAFNLTRAIDVHPRHCLELCVKYQQKYALMNSNKCLCTNIRLKKRNDKLSAFIKYNCTQECQGNYFYTCGSSSNSTIYSMYTMETTCPRGFKVIKEQKRCVHANISANTISFTSAQAYCKSVGGMLAKINDVLEIQDILPKSVLARSVYSIYSSDSARRRAYNESKYFWIDRKSDVSRMNTASDDSIVRCSLTPHTVDGNCIVLRYEKIRIHESVTYQQCFTESDQCSSMSAIPVCVDEHLELNSTVNQPSKGNELLESVNTTVDYSCGNNAEYHLINGFCYKVNIHEVTWHDAKSECERENTTLFIPEDELTLKSIRSLFLRQRSYTSSSVIHVGVFNDKKDRSGTKYDGVDESSSSNILDSDSTSPSCGKTFRGRYLSAFSSMARNDRSTSKLTGCGYVDLRPGMELSISCDKLPCEQLAAVVCQKASIPKSRAVVAKLVYDGSSLNGQSTSVGKHLTAVFWMFSLVFILLIIGFTYVLYKRYLMRNGHNIIIKTRGNNDSAYSQLSTGNELDLN
ncbi:unnamed protein product [Rotaria socialis]|uniref:C-type lectin domain-containing protein n=1 Tax=Rotaria socialis TaxID=392032 RepID=A0A820M4S9_9BILA|nr:unnamed protein product [Rotaria socialis]